METTKLKNGQIALAKKGYAVTYANTTQANARAAKLNAEGIKCFVGGNRPFFVIMEQ